MTIIFEPDLSAQITVDEEGRPRHVRHLRYLPAAAVVPARAAADYLRTNADVLALPPEQLDHLHQPVSYLDPYDAPVAYRLADVKAFFDTSTVVYYQTVHNTPVWDGGLHVTVKQAPPRVVGAELRGHADLELELPDRAAIARVKEALVAVDAGRTAKSVSLRDVLPPASRSKDRQRGADAWVDRTTVTRGRFFVYRYVAADRVPDNAVPMAATSTVAAARQERRPLDVECHDVQLTLPLPPVPRSVADGRHYLVAEVVFRVRGIGADNLHWKALVEVGTGAVLWLRALTAGVSAMVFPYDPKTGTGDLTKTPDQADAVLNPLRQVKTLPNLNAPVMGVQSLIGSRVRLSDDTTPTIAPPTEGAAVDFDFDARTNDFAAANAYFHADNLFDVIESLGFALPTYFDGTTFPVHLDHRSHYYDPNGIEINAFCNGDGQSDGIGMVGYCLSDTTNTTQPLGRSVDKWVHWHELGGHGILWDHVNSANLGFSHSAGDSMAAFQNDPESQLRGLPQRFQYAPFRTWPVGSDRWFNRDVAAGWGWGGSQDQNGYLTEQILATTMFRIYQAIGGDAADVNKRWHASRVATYLILNAVGKLSPGANANSALDFYNTLVQADSDNWTSEGLAGGAYHKLIRWSFEKQGLFQPPGTSGPTVHAGAPPAVDLYVDDGRGGEYPYQAVHWENPSIWNRTTADGIYGEQPGVAGVPSSAYVKVKNRGTTDAAGTVRLYHCLPGAGLVWPTDFVEATPVGGLPTGNVQANNGNEVTVGPFTWTPNVNAYGHDCLLAVVETPQDPSNVSNFTPADTIQDWRLVPHDNNVGQRNVQLVPAGGGGEALVEALDGAFFLAGNTLQTAATFEVRVQMPAVLAKRRWSIHVAGDATRFRLEPGERRRVQLAVKAGRDFGADDVDATEERSITVEVYGDGMLVGGMIYRLDPKLRRRPLKRGSDDGDCRTGKAKELLDCLEITTGRVKDVVVTKVSLDVVMDEVED